MSLAELGPESKPPLFRPGSLLELSGERKASAHCAVGNINLREVKHLLQGAMTGEQNRD